MSNYLIELSVIHVAFIVGYWFLLRKERQYAKMRFYLVGATSLALIIPLLKLPKVFISNISIAPEPIDTIPLGAITVTPIVDKSIWNYELLMGIYLIISACFLFKFLSNVFYLINLERKSSYEKFNDLYIRKVENIRGSFTFFNWIFLSNDIDKSQQDYEIILKHEKAHASLKHTYDILFFELFKVCFWWLPTAWFIIKEIKKIHEYQADAYALKSYNVDQYSSILISSILKSNGLSLASSVYDGLILKRLIAMKQKTKNVSPLKIGILSVLCASLFIVFACSEEPNLEIKEIGSQSTGAKSEMQGEVFAIVEELPKFKGGMNAFYQYVGSEIQYPTQARQKGIEGLVNIQFVVEKDGSLSGVKAINGIGAGCDKEAVRVIQNAPSFKPGKQRGKAVRVRMALPINFKINEGQAHEGNSTKGTIAVEKVQFMKNKLKIDAHFANGEWSGIIYDEEGKELPGANIVVAGTTSGTVSDFDGTFKVKTNVSKDLHVSFVGYESVRLEGK
ncbi:MAG: TonB family protein [Bacteroidota bacterium]